MGIELSVRGTGPSYIILGKFDGAPFLATVLVAKMGADNILKRVFDVDLFSNICSIFLLLFALQISIFYFTCS